MELHLFWILGVCFGATTDYVELENGTVINDLRIYLGIIMVQILW